MYSNSEVNFEATMLVLFTLFVSISGSSSVFTKYELQVFVGRTFSSDAEVTAVSNSKTECIVSLGALTNDIVKTIAVYNEETKSCTKFAIGSQSLFLQETGSTATVALWNTNVCSLVNTPESVYYEYVDTDLPGFDIDGHRASSPMECAHICITNHGNAFKGFLYRYGGTGTTVGCGCKRLTVKEFQDLGHTLNFLSGYSHYDRMCFN